VNKILNPKKEKKSYANKNIMFNTHQKKKIKLYENKNTMFNTHLNKGKKIRMQLKIL
jgi:hypothetical protein